MAIRHRPTQEFEETPRAIGPQLVTLGSLNGGLNSYANPELLSPQMWSQASQIYSGQFGAVRRARFAPVVNPSTSGYTAQAARFSSLFNFRDATPQDVLLGDIGNTIWSFNINSGYAATQITDGVLGLASSPLLTGPWSRFGISGIVFGMNGQSKRHFRGVNLATTENWGLDTPDSAPFLSVVSTGPDNGSTATDLADRSAAWTNPNNIFTTGASFATATSNSGTNTIRVAGFGFAIGAAIPIYGVQFTLHVKANVPGRFLFCWAQLVKAGVPVGPQKGIGFDSTNPVTLNFGSSGDTFGQSLIGSDVNSATFGVQFYFTMPVTITISANSSQCTVFTPGGSGPGGITKIIGRSYTYAWENANIAHVGAPSPASPYIPETNQTNTIDCFEAGTATTNGTTTVTINGATPSAAWAVTRHLWVNGNGDCGRIASVNVAAGTLTLVTAAAAQANAIFQIFDPQATHIRLYATGDGQPVYFRIQRNAWVPSATDPVSAGLVFMDNDNSEPPNGEFTSEIQQLYNIPPPIGTYVSEYQSRLEVWGVPGAPQSFFYSNFENTNVGLPWDSFAPLNQVTLPMGNAQLRAVANLPTGQIIWSSQQDMFKLTGLLTDNVVSTDTQLGATVQRLPYKIGAASAFAVAVTSLGAIWLSSDRQVWLFTDHYAPKNIGQPIQDILSSINGARLKFARMKYYKQGDKNWLELSVATGSSAFNNKKLILDINLLTSNGQPSFFTFDMATNQPTWYIYDVNCEADEVVVDGNSNWHTLSGDLDLITETDWTDGYFTITAEQSIAGAGFTTHALGNEAPEIIKKLKWMRCNTNQLPKYLASQGWKWNILIYDDDQFVLGVSPNTRTLIPGSNSGSAIIGLENSPAVFRLNQGVQFAMGRRFQFQTLFPSLPGFWEFRSYQIEYENVVAR